jgi:NADPH-dependent curcumin reductase CurA
MPALTNKQQHLISRPAGEPTLEQFQLETIAQGIEAAPEAFLGLLEGRNFGKQLVKLI